MSETVYRGVRWRRDDAGAVYFHDDGGDRWVRWTPGGGTPPIPPRWSLLGVATRFERPGWRSLRRIVPVLLVAAAVVVAVIQAVGPSARAPAAEAAKAEALLGRCLPRDGSALGHPRYRTTPVPCGSPRAAVRVVRVVPTTPGSPLCPAGTTGVEIPYAGVRYPHVECVAPLGPSR